MNLATLVRHKNYAFYEAHNIRNAILGIVVRKKGYGNVTVLWSDGKLRTVHRYSLMIINEL
jgi:hypothetical protein